MPKQLVNSGKYVLIAPNGIRIVASPTTPYGAMVFYSLRRIKAQA